jgi:uncharacterized protein YllA (UPF0747 family)
LKYQELPEIPRIWIDFVNSRLSSPLGFQAVQTLAEHVAAPKHRVKPLEAILGFLTKGQPDSAAALRNIQRLQQSQAGVVITNFQVSLLGGPMSQILKCLTAIKVCEELTTYKTPAVPLCWVSAASPTDFRKWSITLLDHETEIHRLHLQSSEATDFSPGNPSHRNDVSALISQIEEFGRGMFDTEILELLRAVFVSKMTLSAASARLIADLMSHWGMLVLDAEAPAFESIKDQALAPIFQQAGDIGSLLQKQAAELTKKGYAGEFNENTGLTFLAQNSMLPLFACVIDPLEVYPYATTMPVLDSMGLCLPPAWPQASATIVDARSLRTLKRYNLKLHQLYSGDKEVIREILDGVPHSAAGKLNDLKSEAEMRIADLGSIDPSGNELVKAAVSFKDKIIYQLDRLRKLCDAAHMRRELALNRQIHRVCNLLAPNRRLQERELAGIQIPLRYSRAGLRFLYEKLDIQSREHQLISMD